MKIGGMKIIGYVNPETLVGKSAPFYPVKHSGVCLIVGTAPCWKEDLDAALKIFPNADICAVNEAVRLVKADHIATSHDGKITDFHKLHLATHGYKKGDIVDVHFRSPQLEKRESPAFFAWDVTVGAGSAPFAAAVMVLIGYDLAVFVGCPMDGGGGYAFDKSETHKSTVDDPRFGFIDPKHQLVQSWKIALKNMPKAIPELTAKWRSMSGYTQTIFGGP